MTKVPSTGRDLDAMEDVEHELAELREAQAAQANAAERMQDKIAAVERRIRIGKERQREQSQELLAVMGSGDQSDAAPQRADPLPSASGDCCSALNPMEEGEDLQGCMRRAMYFIFPPFRWLPEYEKAWLRPDILSGLVVGIMIIPQSMAYAMIAGLPPQYGLYSSFVPLYVYALLGTSKQLAVGPVALISLMTESFLSPLAETGSDEYCALAMALACLVGILQVMFGVLRLGFIVNFLSHATISGFTSAAAILIGLSQLKHILGYNIPNTHDIIHACHGIVHGITDFHWPTFVMGIVWIAMLKGCRELGIRKPKFGLLKSVGPLLVCVIATVLMLLTGWDDMGGGDAADANATSGSGTGSGSGPTGIKIVGKVPDGMPVPAAPALDRAADLMVPTFIVGIVGFVESIAIAKALATKNGYELKVNNEWIAAGAANLIGSSFGSYPTTGSFSRSAVNQNTGAKSTIASVITATLVGLTLICLTPALYHMPKNVLAAIVVSAVVNLVDLDEPRWLWRVVRRDCALWGIAFFGTLLLGVEIGVGASFALSMLFVIYDTARPPTSMLGRLEGTNVYRCMQQYPAARPAPGIAVFRMDAPLYFGNVNLFKEKLIEVCDQPDTDGGSTPQYVVIEMASVTNIDSSGVHMLKEMVRTLRARQVELRLCNPNGDVLRILERGGIMEAIGHSVYLQVHPCVQACLRQMHGTEDVRHSGDTPPDLDHARQQPSSAQLAVQAHKSPITRPGDSQDSKQATWHECETLTPHNRPRGGEQNVEPLSLPMGHQAWKTLQPATGGSQRRSRTPEMPPSHKYELGSCAVDATGAIVPVTAADGGGAGSPRPGGKGGKDRPPSRGRTRPGQGTSDRPWPGRHRSVSPRRQRHQSPQ